MQSPAPQPAAPAAAPTPGQPTAVVVQLPESPIPLGHTPRDAFEVQGLRARREILRDQLERATNRRSELASELREDVADPARAGLQQRLDLLDKRIMQLEGDQALTERLLSSAPTSVLAISGHPSGIQGPVVDEDDAIAGAFGAFGFGVLVTLVVGRAFRRLRRRRGANQDTVSRAAVAPDNPHLERLTLSLDAIAEEVERIGEGQRFVTQLLATRPDAAELAPGTERR